MRIIAGTARGRRLYAPEGADTRPTADRTRESLFNIISREVYGCTFLDVFAGSGAVGLEALSRGAKDVVAFESGAEAFKCIKRNAETAAKGASGQYRPFRGDALKLLSSLEAGPFGVIFLDPPYDDTKLYLEAVKLIIARGLADSETMLILETRTGADFPCPEGLTETDTRKYGEATLRFYRLESSQIPPEGSQEEL